MIVVLASGGVDSALLAYRAFEQRRLAGLVWCHYGQPASLMEYRAVKRLQKHIGAELYEAPLTTICAKDMDIGTGVAGPRVVPMRNWVMIGVAVNYAAKIGASEVQIGAIEDDANNYVDCRSEFFDFASEHASHFGVRVVAPLVGIAKRQVVIEAQAAGILGLTWSCYSPDVDRPCGSCDSCVARDLAVASCAS